jgi:serine O-acetyltransferase
MMSKAHISEALQKATSELSESQSLKGLFHRNTDESPLPSHKILRNIVDLCRGLLFPGYFGNSNVKADTLTYHIGVHVEQLHEQLSSQILSGLCFGNDDDENSACTDYQRQEASALAAKFISSLPALRRTLATDVEAMFNGDPAALNHGEVISCYPAIRAITNYRIAHRLLELGVPIIPRFITEMAHSETGIDIHPGATIGHHFAIDHGTGVVIGATCIIGNNVKLYQGVTLGAKSFPLDENGNPIKGIPRHPILEDDVIVYSNATILGRITIGKGAIVGGNIWVTEDVKPGARITQNRAKEIDNFTNYAI